MATRVRSSSLENRVHPEAVRLQVLAEALERRPMECWHLVAARHGLIGVMRPLRGPRALLRGLLTSSTPLWGSPVERLGARCGVCRARGQVPPSRCLPRLPHRPHSRMNMLATPIHREGVLNPDADDHRIIGSGLIIRPAIDSKDAPSKQLLLQANAAWTGGR